MRKLYLASTSLLALANLVGAVPTPTVTLSVETSLIGPFEEFQEDSEFTLSYTSNVTILSVSEMIRVKSTIDNRSYYISSKPAHKSTKSQSNVAVFPLKTHSYFGPTGFVIQIVISDSNGTLYDKSITLYPIEKQTVNVTNSETKMFQSEKVAYQIRGKRISSKYDDFNFVNFKDYVDAYLFYTLDVSRFNFLYNQTTLEYESAYLSFPDEKNKFKYLDHKDGKINLQLEIVNDGETKSFKYKNPFYVDRHNLDTSSYYISGFSKVDKPYFPVNSRDDLLGTEFQIILSGCGYSKYDFIFDITYDVFREVIGNCFSSDYCVIGEIE